MSDLTLPPIYRVHSAPLGSSPPPRVLIGEGLPDFDVELRLGTQYLDSLTGSLYELVATTPTMDWNVVADLRGPQGVPGDTTLSPAERDDLIDDINALIVAATSPVSAFEAALI